jgi:hypothetical protein
MKSKMIAATAAVLLLGTTFASAQGVLGGASEGMRTGNDAAGPVGGVVGGAVGAVTGGIKGLLGIDDRPRFRQYVVAQHHPSIAYQGDVVVGTVLPPTVTYYEVPADYGVTTYRYTVVNDRIVMVEPGTRRVVQIVE